MTFQIHSWRLDPLDNNTYLIVDRRSRHGVLVDPSFHSEELLPQIRAHCDEIELLLLTHSHFDHVAGLAFYKRETQAAVALHADAVELLELAATTAQMFEMEVEDCPPPDRFIIDSEVIQVGDTKMTALLTPGHAPGHLSFALDGVVLSGDALFAGSIGRTDFPGCNLEQLLHSIRTRLYTLPGETRVLPGHREETTIAVEMAGNPFCPALKSHDRS
ncbi:MAG: MBL fold metallo-hydrolase [Armatimonadetes bacterium]|nr:MBL fold metallo-hydrolase [Armatimonadota bacterium]MDE2206582.1 MBL fold metallo-hydrolase [Armatimonadota bacterium]